MKLMNMNMDIARVGRVLSGRLNYPASRDRGLLSRAGMTLIELMVVILVIAILFAIMMPAVGRLRERARRADAEAARTVLRDAILQYHFEYGRWPIDYSALQEEMVFDNDNNHEVIAYLMMDHPENTKKIPFLQTGVGSDDQYTRDDQGNIVDPWGNPYTITFDTQANTIRVTN